MSRQGGVIVSTAVVCVGHKKRLFTTTLKMEPTRNGSHPTSTIVAFSRPTNAERQLQNIADTHAEYTNVALGWNWLSQAVMERNDVEYPTHYEFTPRDVQFVRYSEYQIRFLYAMTLNILKITFSDYDTSLDIISQTCFGELEVTKGIDRMMKTISYSQQPNHKMTQSSMICCKNDPLYFIAIGLYICNFPHCLVASHGPRSGGVTDLRVKNKKDIRSGALKGKKLYWINPEFDGMVAVRAFGVGVITDWILIHQPEHSSQIVGFMCAKRDSDEFASLVFEGPTLSWLSVIPHVIQTTHTQSIQSPDDESSIDILRPITVDLRDVTSKDTTPQEKATTIVCRLVSAAVSVFKIFRRPGPTPANSLYMVSIRTDRPCALTTTMSNRVIDGHAYLMWLIHVTNNSAFSNQELNAQLLSIILTKLNFYAQDAYGTWDACMRTNCTVFSDHTLVPYGQSILQLSNNDRRRVQDLPFSPAAIDQCCDIGDSSFARDIDPQLRSGLHHILVDIMSPLIPTEDVRYMVTIEHRHDFDVAFGKCSRLNVDMLPFLQPVYVCMMYETIANLVGPLFNRAWFPGTGYMVVGAPDAGKTTWCESLVALNGQPTGRPSLGKGFVTDIAGASQFVIDDPNSLSTTGSTWLMSSTDGQPVTTAQKNANRNNVITPKNDGYSSVFISANQLEFIHTSPGSTTPRELVCKQMARRITILLFQNSTTDCPVPSPSSPVVKYIALMQSAMLYMAQRQHMCSFVPNDDPPQYDHICNAEQLKFVKDAANLSTVSSWRKLNSTLLIRISTRFGVEHMNVMYVMYSIFASVILDTCFLRLACARPSGEPRLISVTKLVNETLAADVGDKDRRLTRDRVCELFCEDGHICPDPDQSKIVCMVCSTRLCYQVVTHNFHCSTCRKVSDNTCTIKGPWIKGQSVYADNNVSDRLFRTTTNIYKGYVNNMSALADSVICNDVKFEGDADSNSDSDVYSSDIDDDVISEDLRDAITRYARE